MFAARILLPILALVLLPILALVSPALAMAEDGTGPDPFDYEPNPAVWRLRDAPSFICSAPFTHCRRS